MSIRDGSGLKRCFIPTWLIEHKVSGKIEKATIVGPQLLVHYKDDGKNRAQIFKPYEIGGTYQCYYSDRLKKVHWNRPSVFLFNVAILCGTASALLSIILPCAVFSHECRRNCVHRNGRNENTQPHSAVPEEDTLVTPPPPYTPSIASADEENNLVTPPPPYTPSISDMEQEQENIPISPPPVYTTR